MAKKADYRAGHSVRAYCVKCRGKVTLSNPWITLLPRGRSKVRMWAYRDLCPKCGTWVYRIIGKSQGK